MNLNLEMHPALKAIMDRPSPIRQLFVARLWFPETPLAVLEHNVPMPAEIEPWLLR